MGELFFLHSSLPDATGPIPISLSYFPYLFCPAVMWRLACLFGSLRSLPAFSRCSIGGIPYANVFLMYLWEEDDLHVLLSAIFPLSPEHTFLKRNLVGKISVKLRYGNKCLGYVFMYLRP